MIHLHTSSWEVTTSCHLPQSHTAYPIAQDILPSWKPSASHTNTCTPCSLPFPGWLWPFSTMWLWKIKPCSLPYTGMLVGSWKYTTSRVIEQVRFIKGVYMLHAKDGNIKVFLYEAKWGGHMSHADVMMTSPVGRKLWMALNHFTSTCTNALMFEYGIV